MLADHAASPGALASAVEEGSTTRGSTGSSTAGSPSGSRPPSLRAADRGRRRLGVRLARERGWQVAVRSGGHSWAQWSVRDDALVIDLGGSAGDVVRRDDRHRHRLARRSRAAPSWRRTSTRCGRFFPGGHCPTVGIGGFLLQGGQGWNARGWGWAAEYVEAVDVVTADGELVRADAERERRPLLGRPRRRAGLLRRGHPLPPAHAARPAHVAQTVQAYALDDFDEVMTWLHEAHHTVADTVEIVALTKTDPTLAAEPGPAGHRRRAGRRRGRGRRRAGAVPRQPGPRPRADGRSTPCRPPSRSSASASSRTTPRATAGRSTTPGSPVRPTEVLPAMRRAYTTLPNDKAFTIWFSMAPLRAAARHGVLDAVGDLPRVVRALGGPGRRRAAPSRGCATAMADLEPVTVGQYLGDSDLRRRQVKFLSDDHWARLQEIRPSATPTACSSATSPVPTAPPTPTTSRGQDR